MFHHFERRRCVSLAAVLLDHERREENRDTQAMGRVETQRSAQRGRPAVPDRWTGRPGGSGAQPPLHLIYMVKVGRPFLWVLRRKPNFWAGGFSFKEALADCLKILREPLRNLEMSI